LREDHARTKIAVAKQMQQDAAKTLTKQDEAPLARLALRFTAWAERWYPDAYVFVAMVVVIVALAAVVRGASPFVVAKAFGDGFWSLITFSLQVSMIAINGYVVASAPLVLRLIDRSASLPRSGRTAVAFVAAISVLLSLLNWSVSLIFSGLLARALARRAELKMDYRAAGAAAYLGLGATWALGLTSAPAQIQANAASLPKSLLAITGVIPMTDTIYLWQSIVLALALVALSVAVSYFSAPAGERAVTAEMMGVDLHKADRAGETPEATRPAEWLEHSPVLTILVVALGVLWIVNEFSGKNPFIALSNLNTYNFVLFMVALLLHWRPKSYLKAAATAVPAISGVLVQFPFYGGIAAILTTAAGSDGHTLSDWLARFFISISSANTFPSIISIYSAVLGFFLPSGGGKWIIEAPYVIQAAKDLHIHLGWTVQIYNAAEALPNLINPFWMLPLLGVLAIKARDIVGFTFLQFVIHLPIVLLLVTLLAGTLTYAPPVIPQ
jgi:short-chain fatty acids transporter